MSHKSEEIDIIGLAFKLAEAVSRLLAHARRFFYEVVLSSYACPRCGGKLAMLRDGRCRCMACGLDLDPTVAFQRCSACGGILVLRISRYRCRACGADIQSRFLFDGLVFDAEYFRQKMAESRHRKCDKREQVRKMLAESRSGPVSPPPADLEAIPGLLDALNGLTVGVDVAAWLPLCKGFDLNRYQRHVQGYLSEVELGFDDIPPLDQDARLDRIWRFIAIIFLAHAGQVIIEQEGQRILVRQNEANREGQGISG
jgi:predicted RNA-binding Zn-ribbon protein involved in translation (DUF1610 family)